MPCREPIHGQRGPAPRGLGRLQQLTHGARAFLRNLRYPPPRQARGADTTLRVRIIPCMSRPAQHLDLATDAQTGKRRWHSDRRIGAHLQQPGLAQPIVAQDWLAADADPPRATCATPRRATPLRTSCKDMACPRAAWRPCGWNCPAAWPQLRPPQAQRGVQQQRQQATATARTRSRPARVARQAEGTRPSWPALLASSAGPAAASRACQYGRNKVASSSRPSARRRPDEIGLRRAGRHDGPGIRIARPRRSGTPFGARRACTVKLKGSPRLDRAISWYAGSPEPAACRPWAMP